MRQPWRMPARFRAVVQALKSYAIEVRTRPGKGSHVILHGGGGLIYPVSLHNGDKTELSDVYVRGICRAFGIDYQEFKSKL